MPKFLLKFGVAAIKEVPWKEGVLSITLGRKQDNDIIIDNPSVSGHHLRITKEDKKYFVEDLQSTNGTFINDQKIVKAEIHDKDIIQIALSGAMSHMLVFFNEDEQFKTASPVQEAVSSDATIIIDAAAQKEMLAKMSQQAKSRGTSASSDVEKIGFIKVVDGIVDKNRMDFEVEKLVTYIGKGEQCDIKIKGLFAPEIAAAINRRPGVYKIIPVKEGYPKLNGIPLKSENALAEGDIIEAGKTKMIFFMREASLGQK